MLGYPGIAMGRSLSEGAVFLQSWVATLGLTDVLMYAGMWWWSWSTYTCIYKMPNGGQAQLSRKQKRCWFVDGPNSPPECRYAHFYFAPELETQDWLKLLAHSSSLPGTVVLREAARHVYTCSFDSFREALFRQGCDGKFEKHVTASRFLRFNVDRN